VYSIGEKQLTEVLCQTIVGPLMNKVKANLQNPPKNSMFAKMISPTIYLIAEHLIPLYLESRKNEYKKIKKVHEIFFLFNVKMQGVFQD
jgi:hypothetical protein